MKEKLKIRQKYTWCLMIFKEMVALLFLTKLDSIGEDSTFRNIPKVRKSKDVGMKDKRGKGREVVDRMVSNTPLLEDCGENGCICWSIAKCLSGVHVFHPLSRSIWTCSKNGRPSGCRKSLKYRSGIHQGETPEPDITNRSMLLTYGNTCTNSIKQEQWSLNKTHIRTVHRATSQLLHWCEGVMIGKVNDLSFQC